MASSLNLSLRTCSETGHHRIRLRFDVSYDIDAAMFTCKLKSHLENEFPGGSGSPPEVGLADIYPTAYSVIVSVYSTEKEEQVRNKILFVCVDLMQSMRKRRCSHRPLNAVSLTLCSAKTVTGRVLAVLLLAAFGLRERVAANPLYLFLPISQQFIFRQPVLRP